MNCFSFAYVCDGDPRYLAMYLKIVDSALIAHLGHTRRRSGKSATSEALFFLHARSDGLDDRRRHLEGIPPISDVVPVRNPIKIGIDRPDITIRILMDQQPHRLVQAGIWI